MPELKSNYNKKNDKLQKTENSGRKAVIATMVHRRKRRWR